MKKKTFWILILILLIIPTVPFVFGFLLRIFSGLGGVGVDDWVYSGNLLSFLSSMWGNLGLVAKLIIVCVTLFVIRLLLIPLQHFSQGLICSFGADEYEQKKWHVHELWCGAPMVFIFFVLYAFILAWVYGFLTYFLVLAENNVWLIPLFIWGFILFFLLLVAKLFFGGLFRWIFNRGDDIVRKTGRSKFLFSFYYLFLLIIPLGLTVIFASLNCARSSNSAPSVSMGDTIGLAVGGANDINNFRENIKNGYLPIPTDITHEGLYYDYTFDTGMDQSCEKLFCPSYSTAISPDPFSSSTEYFLSVGLNSGIKQEDFARKKLNLVIVMDVSGSMSSSFNRYYYDQFRTDIEQDETFDTRSKMQIANESVVMLLDHLDQGDSFGMVLFDNSA